MPNNKNKGKILVVDDYPNWRELLSTLLREEGHEVTTVSGFNEAKKVSDNYEFDVVLLDVRLIDSQKYNAQGIEFLKYIKEKHQNIGAIVLTGYPSQEHKDLVLNVYSADAYFPKVPDAEPVSESFTIDGLCDLVNKILQAQTRHRPL